MSFVVFEDVANSALHVSFAQLAVERSHMSGDFFILYLHQNYLDFFSEVEDVERASEYLSDADLLASDWEVSLSIGIKTETRKAFFPPAPEDCVLQLQELMLSAAFRAAAPWDSTGRQWPPGGSCTPTPNKCLSASGRFTNPTGCSSTRR